MRTIKVGFPLTLCFLLLAPVAHGMTVGLDEASGFSDLVAPDVSIFNEGGLGPLFGHNIVFACGTADQADFSNSTGFIGGGGEFCGLQSRVLISIIEQELIFTGRDEISGALYEFDLLSFNGNQGCFDNAAGELCADAQGFTSYIRTSLEAPIPIPAAAWLFGSALGLLGWLKRRSVT